jgi:hypothetical protein
MMMTFSLAAAIMAGTIFTGVHSAMGVIMAVVRSMAAADSTALVDFMGGAEAVARVVNAVLT